MKNGNTSGVLGIVAGALLGVAFGCLVTWYPIRLLFCANYNYPDCEQIVLMVWPLYCLIGPLIGGLIAYLLYRRRPQVQADDSELEVGTVSEDGGEEGQGVDA